ncbi:MAG: S-layer homology domain-containing protein [Schwartzia succinivorans]|nr:S-layer homology domain-containing protein [Schwartzia succinivorans]
MQKKLISSLTAAIAFGSTAPALGASNPFEDVPQNHWAYDAVAQLASDGVIEGYGDGTYRGDQEITRFEMAQMIARAMAKNSLSTSDKAMLDKLAAEFSDELTNLGVRVAALEKKTDNVRWNGRVRYRFISQHREGDMAQKKEANVKYTNGSSHQNTNQFLFRLQPTLDINKNWKGHARISYYSDADSAKNVNTAIMDWLWVEGQYASTNVKLGRLVYHSEADYGLFIDDPISGGQVTFGKDVKATLTAGRYQFNNGEAGTGIFGWNKDKAISYQSAEVYNDRKARFTWGIGYHHFSADSLYDGFGYKGSSAGVWAAGLGYRFTPTLGLFGSYTRNVSIKDADGMNKGAADHAYSIELDYMGASPKAPGSFGVFAAYRYLGPAATLYTTHRVFGGMREGDKGWEVGASYTFAPNILGTVRYFSGKRISLENGVSDLNRSALFSELTFFF